MKNPFSDFLFCGIISFQVAAFGLVFGPKWNDYVSLSSISNSWNRALIEAGHPFPEFSAYDQNGVRQAILSSPGQESAVILKGTCSCDESTISNWLDTARQKGEPVTLIVPLDQKGESQAIARNGWKGRILRVRFAQLEQLGLLKEGEIKQLPLLAHVDGSGTILGVQTS